MLVECAIAGLENTHFGALGTAALFNNLRFASQSITGIDWFYPAQFVDPGEPSPADSSVFIFSTIIAMVMAQVCQPLADKRPKWVVAAKSSSR